MSKFSKDERRPERFSCFSQDSDLSQEVLTSFGDWTQSKTQSALPSSLSIGKEGSEVMTKPAHINQKHWDELMASAISPEIASLNFWTVEDPREVDQFLNRNSDRRWKHSEDLVPGWAVTGLDPESGEKTYLGVQYKPDNPRPQTDQEGKLKLNPDGTIKYRKYESALDYPADPLMLDVGDFNYWKQVLDDPSQPIIITEGPKKAASSLSHGYPTVSIPGVTTGQKLGRLKSKLKKFCGVGRTVYLVFDSDLISNPNVCKALDKLGKLISACGAVVKVALLPEVS